MRRLSRIVMAPDGSAHGIYDDDMAPLYDRLGARAVNRASHVEPRGDGWIADLSPVGGPVLGPFALRRDALGEEVAWLDSHVV